MVDIEAMQSGIDCSINVGLVHASVFKPEPNIVTYDRQDDLVLRILKDKVPVLHMTFSVTADVESLQTLTQWVRNSVHPQAVIAVGLQPSLVAGVYLRTPNHIHDFSVRGALEGRHGLLIEELETLRGSK